MESVGPETAIAYYVSAHGYGHGVRSTDIIRKLNQLLPLRVVLVSALPRDFLESRLGSVRVEFRGGAFDVGMVQKDSIRVDLGETFRRLSHLVEQWDELVEREARWLRDENISLVVADIPAIPLEASYQVGIASVLVANFTWDWIYEEFAQQDPAWLPIVSRFRDAYRHVNLLLRPPFHGGLNGYRKCVDIPLVSEPGRPRRADLARLTNADERKKWVLLSFTSLEWDADAVGAVERLERYEFFTVYPLHWDGRNIHAVRREDISFSDVMASVDYVISKPGYGLLSECVVNRKPLIYADRSLFREYDVLLDWMKRYVACVHIPSEKLYRGELAEALEQVEQAEWPKEILPADGGKAAAQAIVSLLRGTSAV